MSRFICFIVIVVVILSNLNAQFTPEYFVIGVTMRKGEEIVEWNREKVKRKKTRGKKIKNFFTPGQVLSRVKLHWVK